MSSNTARPDETQILLGAGEQKQVSGAFRWFILLISCLLAFGGYFVYDMCSCLETSIKREIGIDDVGYSLLYVVYSWTNCAMVLFGGPLIDKTSNRLAAIIFSTACLLGQVILSIGAHLKIFPVMLAGRILFGIGLGNITVVQNAITTVFFKGKELALAFGITLTASRAGSVLNFFISPWLDGLMGYRFVFWLGTGLCGLSWLAAVLYFTMEKNAEKAGLITSGARRSRSIKLRDIKTFPANFWLLAIICALFYSNIFNIHAVIVEMLQKLFDLTPNIAGIESSTVYFVSVPANLITGWAVDRIGHRAHLLLGAVLLMVPVDLVIGLTRVPPVVSLVFAGIAYSIVASTLWTGISLLVDESTVGTAMSIATSIQMVGVGLGNLLVGVIVKAAGYSGVMLFFTGMAGVAALFVVVVNLLDRRLSGGKLNYHIAGKKAPAAEKKPDQGLGAEDLLPPSEQPQTMPPPLPPLTLAAPAYQPAPSAYPPVEPTDRRPAL